MIYYVVIKNNKKCVKKKQKQKKGTSNQGVRTPTVSLFNFQDLEKEKKSLYRKRHQMTVR